MSEFLETDYLVVGAGAMGLAFADTLLKESDARIVIVDRHGKPGGHWGDAYSFVRLHQPSAFYGVNSLNLGQGRIDAAGPNRGLYEAAGVEELLDYFARVMQALLASGRVRYLPLTDFQGEDGGQDEPAVYRCQSLLDGHRTRVQVRRKLVNATHTGTAVPATHAPRYRVDPAVQLVTPNELPQLALAHPRYTVIGAGKTGMDACMWLMQNGVAPGRIRWVMPNDAWLIDRANVQPGNENLARFFGSLAEQFESIAGAHTPEDLFDRLEASGQLLRLDPGVRPARCRRRPTSAAGCICGPSPWPTGSTGRSTRA